MIHQITWHRESAARSAGSRPRFTRWLHARRQENADADRASALVTRWNASAAGAGLSRDTSSCAGLPGIASPQVTHVTLGTDSDRLHIRMLPGQLVADYQERVRELAEGLGVRQVRITRRSYGYLTVDLLAFDPLASVVPVPAATGPDVLLGLVDTGERLSIRLADTAHMIVQGQTRSGKSRFTYGLLVQLADAPDVLVCGSDVTGLLLRPFKGTRHETHQALGTADIEAHAHVLERLVRIMDDRIARMPEDRDVFPCDEDDPYLFTVLEELPGLLRAARAIDDQHKGQRGYVQLVGRIQSAFGRLLAEGAKVGFRLLLITQRADASIVGGFERGQAPLRISFAVENAESVGMLHPAVPREVAEAHVASLPGYALVSGPGLPYARLRAPQMGDYQAFRGRIRPDDPEDGTGELVAV